MGARMVTLIVETLVHLFDWAPPGDTDPVHLDMKEKSSIKELPLGLIPKTRKLEAIEACVLIMYSFYYFFFSICCVLVC